MDTHWRTCRLCGTSVLAHIIRVSGAATQQPVTITCADGRVAEGLDAYDAESAYLAIGRTVSVTLRAAAATARRQRDVA